MLTTKQIIPYLKNAGFSSFLEVQEQTVETYKKSGNVILYSRTGSGKTIAFLASIIAQIDPNQKGAQAIIIAPTRELAIQISDVFKSLQTGILHTLCYGGHEMRIEKNNLKANPSIIIGTPGRIADHLERDTLNLDNCNQIVIDEFDKCLELGFDRDMGYITSFLTKPFNQILVSATRIDEVPVYLDHNIPEVIDQLEDVKIDTIEEIAVPIEEDTFNTLHLLTKSVGTERTIIFCNYREVCEDVSTRLNELGHHTNYYHGGLEQDERERSLIKFKNGTSNILISTDLASRGIDIENVKHVIHYQYPNSLEAFTHRKGRTGRMNKTGNSYIFIGKKSQLPEYLEKPTTVHEITEVLEFPKPKFETLYLSSGKKDKINKIDIVGFLSKQGHLNKDDIGIITVGDYTSYVAIAKNKINQLIKDVAGVKIKKKKVKIEISK